MHKGALPLSQQILLDIVVPPAGTLVWWLMSRGWASAVQGGKVSEATRRRQRRTAIVVLVAVYALMFGITIYAQIT